MRRTSSLTLIATIVLLVLSACNLGGGPEGANGTNTDAPADNANGNTGEPVTISFAVQEFERSSYEPLVEQFNTDNPDIRVQLISIDELFDFSGGSFEPTDYARSIVSGADTANLFSVDASAIEAGLFTDLTPLMDADTSFDRDDFYPGAFGPVSQGDSIYMLPSIMRVNLLSYNKDLWAASGVAEPSLDWNWNDMIAAAEQLAQTRGDDVDVYGVLEFGGGFSFLLNELNENGINLLQTPAEEIQLDDPTVIATLERMSTLAESGAIFAEDPTTSFDELPNLILDQRAGMWSPDILSFGQDPAEPTFEVGTLPYPSTQSSLFGGNTSGFVMSSGTQYPQESWRWLTFISQQNIENAFQQGNIISVIPARRSIAEQTGYWDDIDEATASVIQTVVEQPTEPVTINFQNITSLFEVLTAAVTNVLSEEQNPEEALREAQSSFEENVAEIALTPQPTPDTGPVVVSTPVSDIAPEGATTFTFNAGSSFGAGDIRALARTFNENNPDLFVEITTPDFSGGGLGLNDIAASADCFSWWSAPSTNEFTATLDLQPLIDADAAFDRDDYPTGLLAPFRQGDGLYGLPYTVNFRTLYYEQTMFEAAGLEPPTAGWTLDDFLNAAQLLTSGSGGNQQYGYASGSSQTQDLDYFLNQLGAEVTTDNNTQPNFTDPAVIEATKFYVDLVSEFSPHENLSGYTSDGWNNETFLLINEGRVGMWLNFNITLGTVGTTGDANIASAPPPLSGDTIDRSSVDFTGLYISAEASEPNACWRWINYLSQDITNLESRYPARTSVVESDAFAAEANPGVLEVYNAYREALNEADSLANQSEFDSERIVVELYWYYQAVDRAIQGEDLERELTAAQELTEDYLTCRQADTDAHTCATQVDPDYDGFLQPAQEEAETTDE